MFYLHCLSRSDAERIKSLAENQKITACPTLERLKTASPSKNDIIFSDLSYDHPYGIQKKLNRSLCVVMFYDRSVFRNIPPHLIFCNAVFIPEGSDTDEIEKAIKEAEKVSSGIDTLRSVLVGSSSVMEKTRTKIEKAISSGCMMVHLSGDTGTGKNIAAGEIHRRSGSKTGYIYESCGMLSSELAESAFFGHSKGAFSGATEEREGLLAEADGTTFFLDEIEDMSLGMQSKLLHVLETGEYRQLGRDKMKKTNFRLITASNVDLRELIEKKLLRKDFFYRLSSFSIRMPSLSEHMEDIPEIISHYEAVLGIHPDKRITDYLPFMDHNYPGNVRELQTMVKLHHLNLDEEGFRTLER